MNCRVLLLLAVCLALGLGAYRYRRYFDPAAEYSAMPKVLKSETLVRLWWPRVRIVHVRDFHLVPEDAFRADMEHEYQRTFEKEAMDCLCEEHVAYVDQYQRKLVPVLEDLLVRHGTKRIFIEGASSAEAEQLQALVEALRNAEKIKRPELERQVSMTDDEEEAGAMRAGDTKEERGPSSCRQADRFYSIACCRGLRRKTNGSGWLSCRRRRRRQFRFAGIAPPGRSGIRQCSIWRMGLAEETDKTRLRIGGGEDVPRHQLLRLPQRP